MEGQAGRKAVQDLRCLRCPAVASCGEANGNGAMLSCPSLPFPTDPIRFGRGVAHFYFLDLFPVRLCRHFFQWHFVLLQGKAGRGRAAGNDVFPSAAALLCPARVPLSLSRRSHSLTLTCNHPAPPTRARRRSTPRDLRRDVATPLSFVPSHLPHNLTSSGKQPLP